MSSIVINTLVWAAAISSGLMAGVYFSFSSFIMRAFDHLQPTDAVTSMNSINKIILGSWFMPLFFGSSIIALILMIVALMNWSEAGNLLMFMASAVYFFGMFVCTVLFNVPLNNELARMMPNSPDVEQAWSHYLKTWTRWNHLRTISSLASAILFTWLLTQ